MHAFHIYLDGFCPHLLRWFPVFCPDRFTSHRHMYNAIFEVELMDVATSDLVHAHKHVDKRAPTHRHTQKYTYAE